MKYVSLDLETYRLEPRDSSGIIMISMVAEDTNERKPVTDLPHFTAMIDPGKDPVVGSPFALSMNAWLMVAIEIHRNAKNHNFVKQLVGAGIPEPTITKAKAALSAYPVVSIGQMIVDAHEWLNKNFGEKDRITVAGKNVAGFDMQFLPDVLKPRFRHAVIDVGCLFIDWDKDRQVPSTEKVMERIGLTTAGLHDAYHDALAAIIAVRAAQDKQALYEIMLHQYGPPVAIATLP